MLSAMEKDKEENETCICKWRGKGWEPGKISLMGNLKEVREQSQCISGRRGIHEARTAHAKAPRLD